MTTNDLRIRNSIYLVSYKGGMYGEFLCSLISNDCHFYRLTDELNSVNNNKFLYADPLVKLFNFSLIHRSIDDLQHQLDSTSVIQDISNLLDNTHLNVVTRTHDYGTKRLDELYNLIPAVNKVKFYLTPHQCLYTFALMIAKNLLIECSNEEKPGELAHIDCQIPVLLTDMVKYRVYDIRVYLTKMLLKYWRIGTAGSDDSTRLPDWSYVNPYQLFIEPQNQQQWQSIFNLHSPLPIAALSQYHMRNTMLLRDVFGFTDEDTTRTMLSKIVDVCHDRIAPGLSIVFKH